ncbi:MAG: hypothetical protein ABI432_09015 [Flavobacteriales bacterium]
MRSHIIIGDYEFDYCHGVTVESSWKTLADTAVIELPNVQGLLAKQVKPGQAVKIALGYDDLLVTEFEGYVSAVSPKTPMRIECMDEMWKLRQETISQSWRSVSLADVLAFIAPNAIVKVPEVQLSPFRLDKVTRAEALTVVKEQYGLAVFFRGLELCVGVPYTFDEQPSVIQYHMQKNVASFGSLEFRRADDVKVKVKAISIRPDNSRIDVDLGDSDGEQHTLHFYNLTAAELKVQAEQKMALLKFDGYKGSLTAFGFPNCQHSQIAELADGNYPERGGRYFIDAVTVSYGDNGYRREATLGKKAE